MDLLGSTIKIVYNLKRENMLYNIQPRKVDQKMIRELKQMSVSIAAQSIITIDEKIKNTNTKDKAIELSLFPIEHCAPCIIKKQ